MKINQRCIYSNNYSLIIDSISNFNKNYTKKKNNSPEHIDSLAHNENIILNHNESSDSDSTDSDEYDINELSSNSNELNNNSNELNNNSNELNNNSNELTNNSNELSSNSNGLSSNSNELNNNSNNFKLFFSNRNNNLLGLRQIISCENKIIGYINNDYLNPIISNTIEYTSRYSDKIWFYTINLIKNKLVEVSIYFDEIKFEKFYNSITQENENLLDIHNKIISSILYIYYPKKIYSPDILTEDLWKRSFSNNIKYKLDKSFTKKINENFKLLKYQLKNIKWMKNIEDTCYFGYTYKLIDKISEILPYFKSTYSFDLIENKLLLNANHDKYPNKLMRTKGGILADEMGLGKTICCIGLILNDIDLKKLKNNIKTKKKSKKKKEDVEVEVEYENNKIKTNASLVICPSHITKQWEEEVNKISSMLKVKLILTKVHHNNLTYKDLIDSDIIIVSIQFLTNINYYIKLGYKQLSNSMLPNEIDNRMKAINTILEDYKKEDNFINNSCPFIEHFHWKRIIIDEAHEIYSSDNNNFYYGNYINGYLINWIEYIESKYNWYVSGTPFTNSNSFNNIMSFINWRTYITDSYEGSEITLENNIYQINKSIYMKESLRKVILDKIYNRNTIKDVNNEHNIPEPLYLVKFIELTDIEKKIYKSYKRKNYSKLRLRQLCCHFQICDEDRNIFGNSNITLEEVRGKLINHYNLEINNNNSKINNLNLLNTNESSIRNKLKKLNDKNNELKYLVNFFNDINPLKPKLSESTCVICTANFEDVSITKCGHYYCYECISNYILNYKSECPICRGKLCIDEVYKAKKVEKEENKDEKEVDILIYKYGSKMGHLINYCNEEIFKQEDTRIIIFSQWDRLLYNIGNILSENGIDSLYCKGNVWQKTSTLNYFKNKKKKKNKDNKVLMLSLENSASGTNLIEATHIIFLHPIDLSHEDVISIENQAIGRAKRIGQTKTLNIVRFIIKDTIEEELYNSYNEYVNNIIEI